MKNLADHSVSIFLFRFVLRKNAISLVINESIVEDMYPDIDKNIQPLAQACGETLLRYKEKCQGTTIMDGNILDDDNFEVMLSPGLGRYIIEREKQNLFVDAHKIAQLLMEVMERRTKEMNQGTYSGPQNVLNKVHRAGVTSDGLEALGKQQFEKEQLLFPSHFSNVDRLSPNDLPDGVVAKRGYDHRGYCITFEHETFGELGKVVLSNTGTGQMRMEAEMSIGNHDEMKSRKQLYKETISIIEAALRGIPEQVYS